MHGFDPRNYVILERDCYVLLLLCLLEGGVLRQEHGRDKRHWGLELAYFLFGGQLLFLALSLHNLFDWLSGSGR